MTPVAAASLLVGIYEAIKKLYEQIKTICAEASLPAKDVLEALEKCHTISDTTPETVLAEIKKKMVDGSGN